MKYRYDEMTWPEVRRAAEFDPVIVLPVGTTEQHGYHLPLLVDSVCATEIARAAVEATSPNSLLMPSIVYAFNQNQMDFPGTITVDGHALIDYLAGVGLSLAAHGFRHILFVNGHGSNVPFLDAASRRVNNETESLCATVTWFNLLKPADVAWRESKFPGGMGHACELETSVLLHLRPDLVDMSKARDEINLPMSEHFVNDLMGGGPVVHIEYYSRHSAVGVLGQPTLATAHKGELAFKAAVREVAAIITEFRARTVLSRRDLHDSALFPTP